jgi:hypothetical protein
MERDILEISGGAMTYNGEYILALSIKNKSDAPVEFDEIKHAFEGADHVALGFSRKYSSAAIKPGHEFSPSQLIFGSERFMSQLLSLSPRKEDLTVYVGVYSKRTPLKVVTARMLHRDKLPRAPMALRLKFEDSQEGPLAVILG